MAEYRTPEEYVEQQEQWARIRPVLNQAVADAAFLNAAMAYGMPADVVETLVDQVWDGLRDSLHGEDRLAAILLLLDARIADETHALLHEPASGGEGL